MSKEILIKPIISEKSEFLSESLGQYSFVVAKGANKTEIKKAIQKLYNVKVASINTIIVPSKAKSRNTRSGVLKGRVSGYKKAIVTVEKGEEIDYFGDI